MTAFTPSRLTMARRRRGATKAAVAVTLGDITPQALMDFESGRYTPSSERLDQLARLLDFPVEFFSRPEPETLATSAVSFRSLAAMKAGQRESALAAGELALEFDAWVRARFNLPGVDVPDMRGQSPEAAAEAVRAAWGLGVRPIKSMVHLLEAHGVRVFSLSEKNYEVDAFSFWRGGAPFCFLNTMKTAEHSRMDAAHELGHLVLHRHGPPKGKEVESEANEFAAAFLMPRTQVLATVPRARTLSACIQHKQIFGASLAAYVRRLHTVGLLTEWTYRTLFIQLSKAGYRRAEPEPAPHESSAVMSKVFEALRADGISRSDVARALNLHVADLDAMVFGLMMTGLDGGRAGGPKRSGAALKLVVNEESERRAR